MDEIQRTVISRSLLEEYGYNSNVSDERLGQIADELLEHWSVSGGFKNALESVIPESSQMFYNYLDYLHVEIGLLAEDVESVPLSGRADDACDSLADKEYVQKQLERFTDEELFEAVRKLCDNPELTSRKHAIEYIVWMVACNIQEEPEWGERGNGL